MPILPSIQITQTAELTAEASADFFAVNCTPGLQCGPFELTQLLGRGGMGQVFLAKRSSGFVQNVAVKLVRGGGFDAQHIVRFNIERQILARLQHPNIAALIDAGALASGELWIAMEFVDGETLDQFVARTAPDQTQIVRLLLSLARAVAYAERQLIVHRDLKPSNVMVDQAGVLKLLDFGIAKLLGQTKDGDITRIQPYSPRYAAPEQLKNGTITTATNVYQLGILARDLLLKPLDVDLQALVHCALQDDPAERYANAGTMAADFEAWLEYKPLRVRQLNLLSYALKFVRRQPWVAAALAASMAGMLLFSWVAITQAQLARAALQLAQIEQRSSEAVIAKLRAGFSSVSPSTAGKPALLGDLLEFWRRQNIGSDLHADGRVMALAGELSFALGDYDQARALLGKALLQIDPERSESAVKDAAKAAGMLSWIDDVRGKPDAAIASTIKELSLLAQLPPSKQRDLLIAKAQYLQFIYQGQQLFAAEIAMQTAARLVSDSRGDQAHRLVFISRAYQSFLAANSVVRANQMAALLHEEINKTTSSELVRNMLPNEANGNDGLFELLEVANAVGRAGNRSSAEALLADLAAAGEGAFGERHPFAAQFNANYALALLNSGKLRLADRFNSKAIAVISEHAKQFPKLWQGTLTNQGAIARAIGDPKTAAEHYLQAARCAENLHDERGALLSIALRLRALAEWQISEAADINAQKINDLAKTIAFEYAEFMQRWLKAGANLQNNEARFAVATAAAFAADAEARAYWRADLVGLTVPESARFKRALALIYLQHSESPGSAIQLAQQLLDNLPAGTAQISRYALLADVALWRLSINPSDKSARKDAERARAWLSIEQLPTSSRLQQLNKLLR